MGLGMELYARKKNGDVFPVEISLAHYELEGEKLAVAFVTDITHQANAKKLIAEREAWFRGMADHSPVMIWVSDRDRMFSYFNKTWLEFTGRPLEQELGMGWVNAIHPEDLDKYHETFTNAYDLVQPFSTHFRLLRQDGQYRWMECSAKPTYYDNAFTGFIGSCSDVHDQRMMKEELEHLVRQRTIELYEALEREKEMNELKSRFVSMASHEFRTPLSIVLSSTTIMEQYGIGEKDEKIQKHLSRIKSSVSNLTNILNDFLSLDKLEQGNVEIEGDAFDIAEFLNEVVEDVLVMKKSGQTISIVHEGANIVVLDRKKLRYILVNLISNSVKYSPVDSTINVISRNGNDTVVIVVQDRGIGIPEDEQKYLYNKFFRAKNTGAVQGTGLGLTIVKRYVELMKGSISFTSKTGEGTTFVIEMRKG